MAHLFLGETYFDMGEYKKSQECYENFISLRGQYNSFRSWAHLSTVALARAKIMNNEPGVNLTELPKYHEANRVAALDGWISRCLGEILLNIDEKHISEAEVWINKAIEADSRNGTMFSLGKDYALYAEFFKRKGDTSKAKEKLNKAIDLYKECGADGWVEKAEKSLKALSRKK